MEHNIVSVSGGKDSTALLLLAIERQAENLQAVFCDTGNEHHLTYDYLEYLDKTVLPIKILKRDFSPEIQRKREAMLKIAAGEPDNHKYPLTPERAAEIAENLFPTGNPMLDQALARGMFATSFRRFCSTELKREMLIAHQEQHCLAGDDVYAWQGVRRDESSARAALIENELKKRYPNGAELWNYRPILDWNAAQCFEMHRKHGVKHNPLYEMGMKRVGCMPCIHTTKDELLEISKRFPEQIDRIEAWEKMVHGTARHQNLSTFFENGRHTCGDRTFEKNTIRAAVEWSKTGRGGKTFDMFRESQDVAVCSSIYGLCE